MSIFDDLAGEVQNGMEGNNSGIPMGFKRLNKYISIRRKIYTLVFGSTGSGKSSFVHNAWILNPFDWYVSNRGRVKLKIILFSMERSKLYVIAKWVSRRIFIDHGILVPVSKLLGWWEEKLTHDEHDLFLQYRDYIDSLTNDVLDVIEGAQNPTGIYKYMKEYAETNGRIEQESEFKKIYIPNENKEIVLPILDHIGLTRLESGMNKKESIDKASEYLQIFRDFYGYSPVVVSQINRDLGNVLYQKMGSFEPNIDQIKESGRPAEDSDCVISLFDPIRYKTTDPTYDVNKMVNKQTGAKHFRSIKILKNTYAEDDVRIGMAFHGATGQFKELPKASDITDDHYQSILDGSYFVEP